MPTDFKLGLAGDTMLGRGVAETLRCAPVDALFAPEVIDAAHEVDALVLNLECCISMRGEPWPDPHKPFFFRGPPAAVEALSLLGVDCVTLANNHALDFGADALLDTFAYLESAGIAWVGAGVDERRAREVVMVERGGFRLAVIGLADYPPEYAARLDEPGIAYADLETGLPDWVREGVHAAAADAVLAMPHWGPNMAAEPTRAIERAAGELLESGATLVAGHSAHVFQGVAPRVIYDLGDFIDDYAVEPTLRNDLGLLVFVNFEDGRPVTLEALPLKLDYCHTRIARGVDAAWIGSRFRRACGTLGTEVEDRGGRLVIDWRRGRAAAGRLSRAGIATP